VYKKRKEKSAQIISIELQRVEESELHPTIEKREDNNLMSECDGWKREGTNPLFLFNTDSDDAFLPPSIYDFALPCDTRAMCWLLFVG